MTNNNPHFETKPLVPAVLGAVTAAIIVLTIGLVLLFFVHPSTITWDGGTSFLTLDTLVRTLSRAVSGESCSAGLMKWIGLDCRWLPMQQLGVVIAGSRGAVLAVVALTVGTAVAGAVAGSDILRKTPKREQLRTLRGRRPVFDADARANLRNTLGKTGQAIKRGLWLAPHVQLTPAAEGYNILAVGTQGSGKSSTLRALTEQVIARNDHVLVHDAKGDMVAGLPAVQFILVAPHDARSWMYDIADDIRNGQHAREFAAHAVPASKNESMWGEGSRAIWADLVTALRVETEGRWSWDELKNVLLAPGADIKAMLDRHSASSASRIVFGSDDPEENRTTMSILITLWVAALTVVLPMAEAWAVSPPARRFSLRGWLPETSRLPRVIVLQKSSEYPELSASVGAFIIDRLAGLALQPGRKRNPSTKLALCLDELPECNRLARLPNLLNVGREVGVVTIAAVQDIASLVELYGENLTQVLLARFRIKVIHQLDPGDTADRVHRWLGKRNVEFLGPQRFDASSRRMVRDVVREEAEVFPVDRLETDLGVRVAGGRTTIRAMILGLGHPAVLDIPLTSWPDRRPGHVPALWITGSEPVYDALRQFQ